MLFFKVHCKNVLTTNQEEADTKVFLCAQHAATLVNSVCIETVDSDVALYAVYFQPKLTVCLFINYIVHSRRRVININEIYLRLSELLSSSLPALHGFTGNDYTSTFYGIGKSKAYKIIKESKEFQECFSKFGDTYDFDANLFPVIEKFVCRLYGIQACNVNEARYKKFCTSKRTPKPQSLPPTP